MGKKVGASAAGNSDGSASPPAGVRGPVSPWAPLKVPAYRRIWAAFSVSGTGTFLQLTAGPWVMQEMTGSPLMVSLATAGIFGPRLLLSLPAGALADVIDRRILILAGQGVSAIAAMAIAILTMIGTLEPWSLLVLTLAIGVGNSVSHPSFMSLVPELVPRPLMPQAITLNSAAANLARAVGPSLGGALVAVGLTHVAFGANAVSYLAVMGVVLTFKREQMPPTGAKRNLWRSTMVGIRYVRFTRSIRILIIYTAIFNLSAASLQALLPSFASVELGTGAAGYGLLFGLLGAGAVVGAGTRERIAFVAGRHLLPTTITVYGVLLVVIGLTRSAIVAGVLIFIAGTLWIWTATTFNSSVQVQAPRWVRGRVVSVYVVAQGMQPVGALVAGAVAEVVGAGPAIVIMASISVVLGLMGYRLRLPVLGELSEPEPAPQRVVPLEQTHAAQVGGSPIVVVNEFRVGEGRVEEFLRVMVRLRRERLRTGATRWQLFRDAGDPWVLTEMFEVPDWEEHLAQHARIDARAAAVIAQARAFDVAGGPVSRHLAGLDVLGRSSVPLSQQLLTVHAHLHEHDGSVPLGQPPPQSSP